MTETLKYLSEVFVSGLKQSFGMTDRKSLADGKSEAFHFRAFPWSPLIAIPVISNGSSITLASSSSFGAGGTTAFSGGSMSTATACRREELTVVGRTKEVDLDTDWKAEVVLTETAKRVAAWENFMVIVESNMDSIVYFYCGQNNAGKRSVSLI